MTRRDLFALASVGAVARAYGPDAPEAKAAPVPLAPIVSVTRIDIAPDDPDRIVLRFMDDLDRISRRS